MLTAQQLIERYNLQPHPEGGHYRENYKGTEFIPKAALPKRFNGSRSFSTAIYFLLEQGSFSTFHRIKSDECWHFYAGEPLLVYIIQPGGMLDVITLGHQIEKGQCFQYVVPANCWFASKPAPQSSFAFVGCTVAPGFDFEDFELANKETLLELYPQHNSVIREISR